MPTLTITSIGCISPSSGVDPDVAKGLCYGIGGLIAIAGTTLTGGTLAAGLAAAMGALITSTPDLASKIGSTVADDLYVTADGRKIWPDGDYYKINSNDKVYPNVQIQFTNSVVIELWESDSGSDDSLGSFTISVNAAQQGFISVANPDEGSIYVVGYEIFGVPTKTQSDSASTTSQSNQLSAGQALMAGSKIVADNQKYNLIYQDDGNLVLYGNDNRALWNIKQYGYKPGKCVLQSSDGQLVVYDDAGKVRWLNGRGIPHMRLGNDGVLTIFDAQGNDIWNQFGIKDAPIFSFQSIADGKYIAVESDGNNLTFVGDGQRWETQHIFQRVQNQRFRIKTMKGSYWIAQGGGGNDLNASSPNPSEWETFDIQWINDSFVSLKTWDNNHFVSTNRSYSSSNVTARASSSDTWERFALSCRNLNALHLMNSMGCCTSARATFQWIGTGQYMQAVNGGGSNIILYGCPKAGAWETFQLVLLPNNQCFIQASNNKYLIVEDTAVLAYSNNKGEWEKFTLEWFGDCFVALRAHTGKYLSLENGKLAATKTDNSFRFGITIL